MTKLNGVVFGLLISIGLFAQSSIAITDQSGRAAADSAALVQAAKDEIQISQAKGNTQTACDLYLINVLDRAGFPIGHFLANDLDKNMQAHLASWKSSEFSTDHVDQDQTTLKLFLNGKPDGTVFLAQWSRVGESGHVALIEKVAVDDYLIFQAQAGLSLPFSSPIKIRNLLYPKGAWGDRSHLKLFYEW